MPGLTLWMQTSSRNETMEERFQAAQSKMLHMPGYEAKIGLSTPNLIVGHVGYPQYPVRYMEHADYTIAIEGHVYNKRENALNAELRELCTKALNSEDTIEDTLRPWIMETDGEYIVVFIDRRTSRIVCCTDVLRRLPLFYYKTDSAFALARECKFIQAIKPGAAFDRLGVAEYLTLGHGITDRTLYEHVRHCPSAMLLKSRCDGNGLKTSLRPMVDLNFDDKMPAAKSRKDHAPRLVELFLQSCRNIGQTFPDKQLLLSLSGGKDSRASAIGLAQAGVPFDAITHDDQLKAHQLDTEVARKIAELAKMPWHLLDVTQTSEEMTAQLTWMKDGLNDSSMLQAIAFQESLHEKWGFGAIQISGLCANALHDVRQLKRATSLDDVTAAILRKCRMKPVHAEAIMQLEPGTLASELRAALDAYPEESLIQKGVHFNWYAHVRHWEFDGEDRARLYTWETSPFASLPFFIECIRIPDKHKNLCLMLAAFLQELSPQCAKLPDADYAAAPGSWKHRLKMSAVNRLAKIPDGVKDLLRPLAKTPLGRRPYTVPAEERAFFDSFLRSQSELAAMMSNDAVDRFLSQARRNPLGYLKTVVRLDQLWSERHARKS